MSKHLIWERHLIQSYKIQVIRTSEKLTQCSDDSKHTENSQLEPSSRFDA